METLQQAEEAAAEMAEKERRCCCMCGDVGFSEDLLQCPVCCFKVQHTYCSSMYPKIDVGKWRCEWCLHDDRKKLQKMEDHAQATPRKHRGLKHAAANDLMATTTKKLHRRGEGDVGDARSSDPGRRWKPKCNIQSPRRRYKLLADVLMC